MLLQTLYTMEGKKTPRKTMQNTSAAKVLRHLSGSLNMQHHRLLSISPLDFSIHRLIFNKQCIARDPVAHMLI